MAKQRDVATLRDAVRSRSFTPGMRELDGLVELLGDPDDGVVRGAEQAIARAAAGGGAVVPPILARLPAVEAVARARALRVVGSLAPKDAAAAAALAAALGDADGRVQRAAANALGRLEGSLGREVIAQALLAAWDETPELPLARAIAEAMGKLGIEEALGRLDSVLEGDAELARIARKAGAMVRRDASRAAPSTIAAENVGDFNVELVLLCRAGLESIVGDELRARCPRVREVRMGAGEVLAAWRGAPSELMSIRTMLGVAFALPAVPFDPDSGQAGALRAVVLALASDTARRILETWTSGAVRYRIEWEGKGHSRGATWQLVDALAAHDPTWVNDPTGTTWQFSIAVQAASVRVTLVPRKLDDPRFLYRTGDVPAASHPTIAAALARASRPRADDVVWDPFVGSGSELIERARAGAYARLIGSDTDEKALAVAQANAMAAGVDAIALDVGDATLHAPEGVTSIITNPPMGRRVARDGSLASLLDAFTDHVAGVLVPGGRLTWLSPLGGRTAARAEANRLAVTLRKSVDMGGFHAELQVWEKPLA